MSVASSKQHFNEMFGILRTRHATQLALPAPPDADDDDVLVDDALHGVCTTEVAARRLCSDLVW